MIKNSEYLLVLHSIDGLGPMRLKALINFFQDPKLVWEADSKQLKELGIPQNVIERLEQARKNLDPVKDLEEIQKLGIKWVSLFDENYPTSLKEIPDPPVILYFKGEILSEDGFAIAVVGTRKMTGYGKMVTEKFTSELVETGFTIVSGLARGVDGTAHAIAVKEGGRTLAVLGGGLNNIYPPENHNLAEQIISGQGAVISEFPPDYPSLPGNFPARNRIISGLSKAVLVTEADIDSGSLITARVAVEQGKDVFAVPGPINSQMSKGPTELIKEGARIVMSASDILEELGISGRSMKPVTVSNNLSKAEEAVLSCLKDGDKHIDEICRLLNLSAATISATLLKMEIVGLVRNLGNSVYCRL